MEKCARHVLKMGYEHRIDQAAADRSRGHGGHGMRFGTGRHLCLVFHRPHRILEYEFDGLMSRLTHDFNHCRPDARAPDALRAIGLPWVMSDHETWSLKICVSCMEIRFLNVETVDTPCLVRCTQIGPSRSSPYGFMPSGCGLTASPSASAVGCAKDEIWVVPQSTERVQCLSRKLNVLRASILSSPVSAPGK